MTTCVSGGICMSRSSLRLGASEGESDALFAKGSGSSGHPGFGGACDGRLRGKMAEQAVALEAFDMHGKNLANDIWRRHHMGGLQIGGAADDLAFLARGPLEQHVDGRANRSQVEGRLLAVDQVLEALQSLIHLCL